MQTFFHGRYELVRELGSGGMGTVYLVRNTALGNLWAIKAIHKTEGRVDLLAEPNILKKLSHPALPRIVDIDEDGENIYIVEDYIEGLSLDLQLQKVRRFPESLVVGWAKQLCGVLGYLHGQSPPIIYRDMKPANLIVDAHNRVKLIDFGIAREYKETSAQDTSYIGTRGYAAPEQYGTAQTDARTDLYSLGVTLYHLLTGQSPNDPPYQLLLLRQVDKTLSEGMERIVKRCVREDPRKRYQSVRELLADLEHIEEFNLTARKKRRARRFKAGLRGVLAAVFCGMIVYGVRLARTERNDRYARAIEQGYALLEGYDYAGAGRAFEEAVRLDGAETGGYLGAAAVLLKQERYRECLDFLEENQGRFSDARDRAEADRDRGYCYLQLGELANAVFYLEKAVAHEPREDWVTDLAVCYARQKEFARAEELLDRLGEKAGAAPSAALVRGQMFFEQGRYGEVPGALEPALAPQADASIKARAYAVQAQSYRSQGNTGEEIRILEQALRELESPDNIQATEMLGQCYYDSGRYGDAAKLFESLLDAHYSRPYIYRNLAVIYQEDGDLEKARETLGQMLALFPEDYTGYVQLAFLTAELENGKPSGDRDYRGVQEYYDQARRYCPDGEDSPQLAPLKALLDELREKNWL